MAKPAKNLSEIRKHYFEERYVIFAPRRSMRPMELAENPPMKKAIIEHDAFDPEEQNKEICPHCEYKKPEYELLSDSGKWLIRSVLNRFPAVSLDNPKAYGRQEIIIETPKHGVHLNDLPIRHLVAVLATYAQRSEQLLALPKIRYVSIFKNEGGKAGASINHAHSQVFALSILPPLVSHEAVAFEEYLLKNGRCPYEDIIAKELLAKVRIVYKDEHMVAFCPYASTAPYGVWITPRAHRRRLRDLNKTELTSLAKALDLVMDKLDSINLSYNYFFHDSLDLENQHFVFKVEPRPNIWAGLELSTGVILNAVFPEAAAAFYRAKKLAGPKPPTRF